MTCHGSCLLNFPTVVTAWCITVCVCVQVRTPLCVACVQGLHVCCVCVCLCCVTLCVCVCAHISIFLVSLRLCLCMNYPQRKGHLSGTLFAAPNQPDGHPDAICWRTKPAFLQNCPTICGSKASTGVLDAPAADDR